jgi:hypothetical protein
MNRFTQTVSFVFALSLAPACGDDDGDGGSGESLEALCQKGCTLQATLACPNDDDSTCMMECLDGSDAIPEACEAEVRAALDCAVNRPASDWECDAEGEATPKEGLCDAEGTAVLLCAVSNNEDGTCPFENDQECDDPTGTDICPAGTDLADCAQ